jgi:hypothetical protein
MHQDYRGVSGKGIHLEVVLSLVWRLPGEAIARFRVRIVFEGRASGAASGQWSFRKGAQGAAGLDRGSPESEDAGIGFLLSRLLVAVPK